MDEAQDSARGAAIYTPSFLRVYDPIVHGFNLPVLWRCPVRCVQRLYDDLASANHLDVGVGTGYFLDRCRFRRHPERIALLDLNANSLTHTARRIARYRPEVLQGDVLRPLDPRPTPFDSVGLADLLHCLPGPMARKAAAFDTLAAVMSPGAVLFGCTLLGRGVRGSWPARLVVRLMNRRGVFSNLEDDASSLEEELERRFEDVRIEVVGLMALFAARAGRSPSPPSV